ncbi:MAG: poly-beta-hydroxybutyrate polymerase [Porticoccaceae bacterium]|nr:MAG: poly-beta-hydroxybutyrate polymerase [Porticoccaceae bacterium]
MTTPIDNNTDDNNANAASSTTTDFLALLDGLIEKIPQLSNKTAEGIDSKLRANITKITKGISPMQLALAYSDWLGHLSLAPGKRTQLLQSLAEKILKLSTAAARSLTGKDTQDTKHSSPLFKHELWNKPPFNILAKGHQTTMDWLKEMATDVPGMESSSSDLVSFINEQLFQLLAPSNSPLTNPEVLKTTWDEKGKNVLKGISHLQRDIQKNLLKKNEPEMGEFKVGENMAITPGKIIFQNDLIELIQYKPTTKTVAQEPVLIVPAWIMKYYILDLSPEKSLVKYLVDQGKTVFMISWKNPDKEDRELCLENYLKSGFFAALDAVKAIVPNVKINAVGYCIGGTLLSIGAATLARENDDSLNSITLLAAQVDFTEPGEIKRFLGASQLAFLDSLMWTDGYLEAASMGDAFKALRAEDMIINPAIERYYLGRETKPNALMAWNADGTRMPAAMHSRYLQALFMENQLASCKFIVDGKPIALQDIRVPFFVIGTTTDHVAPWKSVYKIQHLGRSEVTFLLTTGGHNAGIVCGPEHPRRQFQVMTHDPMDKYIDPDTWVETVETQQGSWWPLWDYWLNEQSIGEAPKRTMGASKKGYKALRDAPGDYVLG